MIEATPQGPGRLAWPPKILATLPLHVSNGLCLPDHKGSSYTAGGCNSKGSLFGQLAPELVQP